MKNELERIANILGINSQIDESRLCLLIQDKIKEKDGVIKKNEFCYQMVKSQNEKLKSQIHNLKNEYAESVGINEYMSLKKSKENLKKNYNKVLEDNHKLRSSIELYRENELKSKLKKIRVEVV